MTDNNSMTARIAKTHARRQTASQNERTTYERRDYPLTHGGNVECYVIAVRSDGSMARVVQSVCTPAQADALVKRHNQDLADV